MYAVVSIQGFQYRVSPDDKIEVPSLPLEVGEQVKIDRVMLVSDGEKVYVGSPTVPGAQVQAEVVSHLRGPKIVVGKYKRRKDYRRKKGHRADLTELLIRKIELGAEPATDVKEEESVEGGN
jgi:large subunit ribosomal protein L21